MIVLVRYNVVNIRTSLNFFKRQKKATNWQNWKDQPQNAFDIFYL
jgi:hypothetical protein